MGDRSITEKQIPERRAAERRKGRSRRRNLLHWAFDELRATVRRLGNRREKDENDARPPETGED